MHFTKGKTILDATTKYNLVERDFQKCLQKAKCVIDRATLQNGLQCEYRTFGCPSRKNNIFPVALPTNLRPLLWTV